MENYVNGIGEPNPNNGLETGKNLEFLRVFLNEAKISVQEAANRMGLTKQSVHHWFRVDDCKMSSVYNIVNACGYSVEFNLERSLPQGISIQHTVVKDSKRLSFLFDALDRCGISKVEVKRRLDLGVNTVGHWAKIDDCFISYVYKIAREFDLKLSVKFVAVDRL